MTSGLISAGEVDSASGGFRFRWRAVAACLAATDSSRALLAAFQAVVGFGLDGVSVPPKCSAAAPGYGYMDVPAGTSTLNEGSSNVSMFSEDPKIAS